MPSNKVNGLLGSVGILAIAAGTYFGVASPILEEKKTIQSEIERVDILNSSYASRISKFSSGDKMQEEVTDANRTVSSFSSLVPKSMDIESASRAIAASLPSGVKLESFNFSPVQKVATVKSNPLSIAGFKAPTEFAAAAPGAAPAEKAEKAAVDEAGSEKTALGPGEKGTDPQAGVSGFNRVPFTIEVSADSYQALARYLDSLEEQPRLMTVLSVDSSRSDSVTAKIYAFAFAGS